MQSLNLCQLDIFYDMFITYKLSINLNSNLSIKTLRIEKTVFINVHDLFFPIIMNQGKIKGWQNLRLKFFRHFDNPLFTGSSWDIFASSTHDTLIWIIYFQWFIHFDFSWYHQSCFFSMICIIMQYMCINLIIHLCWYH